MDLQTLYQETIIFATTQHAQKQQTIPGTDLPYVVHLSNVAMEILVAAAETDNFNTRLAVQAALLHDTLEDTATALEELENKFGVEVADAVSALTKNERLPKEIRMIESLERIKKLPKEVWAVKLADRITNLQAPPSYWDRIKKIQYREEAQLIWNELKDGNHFLASRLKRKIEAYETYMTD